MKIQSVSTISPFYAKPLNFIAQADKAGAEGVVIFNRFFPTCGNQHRERRVFLSVRSITHEKITRSPYGFPGLLFGNIKADICASRGISDGTDVIKMVLAGGQVLFRLSALHKNKAAHITQMIETLEEWMDAKGYKTTNDFKGKLSMNKSKEPYAYRRRTTSIF